MTSRVLLTGLRLQLEGALDEQVESARPVQECEVYAGKTCGNARRSR
ncbi:MAG TPA: hypothetical protein VIV60_25195 [Polyangiaceae bacterium]